MCYVVLTADVLFCCEILYIRVDVCWIQVFDALGGKEIKSFLLILYYSVMVCRI